MEAIKIDIQGLDELIEKLSSKNLLSNPLKAFFQKANRILRTQIIRQTPKVSGRLRGSIRASQDSAVPPVWGRVATTLYYSLWVERGTQAHFPPRKATTAMAGGDPGEGAMLARGIGSRGTRGHWMFARGAEAAEGSLDRLVKETGDSVAKEWEK